MGSIWASKTQAERVPLDIQPATPEAAAAAAKQRLDSLLSADEPDWQAIEHAADDLSAAAALAELERRENGLADAARPAATTSR